MEWIIGAGIVLAIAISLVVAERRRRLRKHYRWNAADDDTTELPRVEVQPAIPSPLSSTEGEPANVTTRRRMAAGKKKTPRKKPR